MNVTRSAVLGIVALGIVACSTASEETSDVSDLTAVGAGDLPWEVRTRQGELVLPNVFYADASETEQLMSTKVHGRHQIDRLVYPTIGNPNLYVKPDAGDAALFVLRIEEGLLAHLGAHWDGAIDGSPLRAVTFDRNDDADGISFYLVARGARDQAESETKVVAKPGVFPVKASSIVAHPIVPGMPQALAARRTVRVEFDQAALAGVPAGLYDIRFEVRKGGQLVAHEFQYNSVRVFDRASDQYGVVNVTDTQVTVGTRMEQLTLAKMKEFVQRVNTTTDPNVREAAFITFNGDLHNGGSPEVMMPDTVANTYRAESEIILDNLKELTLPIFLTAGNHDGYVSTGHPLPGLEKIATLTFQNGLEDAVRASRPEIEEGEFARMWAAFEAYREQTSDLPGGRHVDSYGGKFARSPVPAAARGDATKAFQTWKAIDPAKANWVLYDGFNQWQRTYGPLYTSWDFGKSRYVNMNSYELRQHRRSGWGMYTVNYGGGISRVQADWVKNEVTRGEREGKDIILLAHHDPRGGHNGEDYPYLFELIDYKPGVSSYNYVVGEVYNKYACTGALDWARAVLARLGWAERQESCLHDGLQEWMRPDEFDCEDSVPRDGEGRCLVSGGAKLWSSASSLIDDLATHPNVRTMMLGHTHYNSLEVLQSGDEIVPAEVQTTAASAEALAGLEFATTLRGSNRAPSSEVVAAGARAAGAAGAHRHVEGERRELLILRTTSASNLTSQKHDAKPMYGFATMKVAARDDARGYATPQINEITFFINDGGSFEAVKTLPLDRSKRLKRLDPTNPVDAFFQMDH